jgi:hypothetical protein
LLLSQLLLVLVQLCIDFALALLHFYDFCDDQPMAFLYFSELLVILGLELQPLQRHQPKQVSPWENWQRQQQKSSELGLR